MHHKYPHFFWSSLHVPWSTHVLLRGDHLLHLCPQECLMGFSKIKREHYFDLDGAGYTCGRELNEVQSDVNYSIIALFVTWWSAVRSTLNLLWPFNSFVTMAINPLGVHRFVEVDLHWGALFWLLEALQHRFSQCSDWCTNKSSGKTCEGFGVYSQEFGDEVSLVSNLQSFPILSQRLMMSRTSFIVFTVLIMYFYDLLLLLQNIGAQQENNAAR